MIPVSVRALADLLDAEVAGPADAALDTAVTGLVIDSRQAAAGSLSLRHRDRLPAIWACAS